MNIDGETMSLPEAFKLQLKKSGLARKEGESMTDWSGRCKAWATNSRYWKKEMEAKA
jgi:hypothetical protein